MELMPFGRNSQQLSGSETVSLRPHPQISWKNRLAADRPLCARSGHEAQIYLENLSGNIV